MISLGLSLSSNNLANYLSFVVERSPKRSDLPHRRHKSEVKAMQRHMDKISEQEQRALLKYKIDYGKLKIPTPHEILGRGAFGVVVKASFFGESVAVKMIRHSSMTDIEEAITNFFEEIKICAPLRHSNIVECFGGCWNDDDHATQTCIVLELVPRGDLSSWIKRGWRVTQSIVTDTARGMKYLHSHKVRIMHRDLKPENVLISARAIGKIADFGVSKEYCGNQSGNTIVGSAKYIAPEVQRGENYTERCDVFSFALILLECVCGRDLETIFAETDGDSNTTETARPSAARPDAKHNQYASKIMHSHANGKRLKIPDEIRARRAGVVALVEKCWEVSCPSRPIQFEHEPIQAERMQSHRFLFLATGGSRGTALVRRSSQGARGALE